MDSLREGMMNRIGWFTHLRLVFDNSPHDPCSKEIVQKSDFLNELVESQMNFPLRPVSEYTKATSEIGFTLAQIFDAILTVPGSTLTFDSVLDAITALRTKADCSLNISSIPRVNSFLQRKSNSRDSFFITHDSLNKEITQKQSSPMGGKKARPLPFVSSAGDQELPKEESAEFGGNHNDNDLISQKENNNIVTQTSYQTAFSPMERTQSEFPKDPPSIPHVRLAGVRNMRATTSERPISSGSRTSSTSTSGLLIDCGRAAVKKVLSTPQQAIQMLPCNVVIDNIKGMKLDGHALTDIAGLPRNLIVLNISNCQLSSLKLLSNICKNLKLLNAGFNSIHSLEGAIDLPSLTELYVNNNNLSSLNECGKMDRLRILDASANPLNNLEDIEELAFSRSLQFLQLRDTLVGSLPEYQLQIRALLPAVQVVEEMEAYKYSNFAKIASFALGSSSFAERYTEKAIHDISDKVKHTSEVSQSKIADETLGRVNDSKASKRSQKKDISNIMDQVSSKECTIVSQRNITDSISKSHAFNNPIAAMMIAPPQGLVGSRSKTQAKKKVFKRMTPISVPTSTKHTGLGQYTMFGSAKKVPQSTKFRPSSAKNSEMTTKNSRAALIQHPTAPSKLRVIRKSCAEPIKPEKVIRLDSTTTQQNPNLKELLKEVYQVIKKRKEDKLSVDTVVVVNTSPHIMQQNITAKANLQKKPPPICIDLRAERKFCLRERSINSQL